MAFTTDDISQVLKDVYLGKVKNLYRQNAALVEILRGYGIDPLVEAVNTIRKEHGLPVGDDARPLRKGDTFECVMHIQTELICDTPASCARITDI